MPASRSKQSFPKSLRLRKTFDIEAVKQFGERRQGKYLVLLKLRKPGGKGWRLAIVTSRRVGNAVVRNAWRRRLRAIYRNELLPSLESPSDSGYDVVLIVRRSGKPPATVPEKMALRDEFVKLCV